MKKILILILILTLLIYKVQADTIFDDTPVDEIGFYITSYTGLKETYTPNEKISFEVSGMQINGNKAGYDEGYALTILLTNEEGNYIYVNNVYTNNQGIYNAGQWKITINAPSNPNTYRLKAILFCARDEAECAELYGQHKEYYAIHKFAVVGKEESVCTDSDSGKDYYSKGKTCQGTNCEYDYCITDHMLFEMDCGPNGNQKEGYHYECPNGCENGVCINQSLIVQSCSDQNGNICEDYQVCDGVVLSANDTYRCCQGFCKLPNSFDWRDRHGENWLTSLKPQLTGDCYEQSVVNAFEPHINLYFNQHVDADLSEQMFIDCKHYNGELAKFSNGPAKECLDISCGFYPYCNSIYSGLVDEGCDPYVGRDIYCDSAYPGEDKCCSEEYICSGWESRTWKNSDFEAYGVANHIGNIDCTKEGMILQEEGLKKLIIQNGPIRASVVYAGGELHSRVLVGYTSEVSDWKTITDCNAGTMCVAEKGCVQKACNPTEKPFNVCIYNIYSNKTWQYSYSCQDVGNNWHEWGIENLDYSGENCSQITPQEGYETCHPDYNKRIVFSEGKGDPVWIFEHRGEYTEDIFSIYDFYEISIPKGPFIPPLNHNYWPAGFDDKINCEDKDNDGFCNWGITKDEPITCPTSCKPEKDWDDSDPNIGPLSIYSGDVEPISISTSKDIKTTRIKEETKSLNCNGCMLKEQCYPFGYRKNGEYCNDNNDFVVQLESDSYCDNNFECISNLCVDSKCIEPGFFSKLISWFTKLFGG